MPCYFPRQVLMVEYDSPDGIKQKMTFLDGERPDEYWAERFGSRFVRLPWGKLIVTGKQIGRAHV